MTLRLMSSLSIFLIVSRGYAAPPHQGSLHTWLRADAGATIVDSKVTQWVDQTSNGFIFTPSAQVPTYSDGLVNGLPAITFDGATQLDGNLNTFLANASIFAVFRYSVESSDVDYLYALGSPGPSGSQMTLSRRRGAFSYHYDGRTENLGADSNALPASEWLVSAQIFDGQNHSLYLNSAFAMSTEAANPYAVDATSTVIGNWSSGDFKFSGDLVELLIYDRALSEAERSDVENYLRVRAGLPEFFKAEAEVLSRWDVLQYELDAQPDALWSFDLGGTRANQSTNADASILLSDIDVANKVIWGRLGSGSAPDFMGFVFGFQNTREFYLFDWKKETASFLSFGEAQRGMRVTMFHLNMEEPSGRDFWASDIAQNTTVLRQNDIPWVDGLDYDFSLRLSEGSFTISVWQGDTVLEAWKIDDSTYTSGKFGYFINSLQNVRFGQVFANDIEPLFVNQFTRAENQLSLRWLGGEPPYVIDSSINLRNWTPATGNIWNRVGVVTPSLDKSFFRVRSLGEELSISQ